MGILVGLVLGSPVANAQQALGAAARIRTSPETLLILRPEPGLRVLATDVAAVLELRTGERVEVGEAPPPGLLEAVPAGHVAMARRDGAVLLVLGASGGRSLDATVQLGAEEPAADARAVALAAEDLRDTAAELARRGGPPTEAAPTATSTTRPTAEAPLPSPYYQQPDRAHVAAAHPSAASSQEAIDDGDEISGTSSGGESPTDVDFLLYGRFYGGASTASSAPATGIGTGVGLCVERHCLVVGAEMPLSFGDQRLDVRYRYPTFTSGFYTRPFTFGAFTAGATFGFFTRLGHFRADMGLSDEGLDTDLGARGSLELALEAYTNFDLITEWGVDFTIDRHRLAAGDRVVDRGDQWSPWGQFALRARL